jgi:hypothetical protein
MQDIHLALFPEDAGQSQTPVAAEDTPLAPLLACLDGISLDSSFIIRLVGALQGRLSDVFDPAVTGSALDLAEFRSLPPLQLLAQMYCLRPAEGEGGAGAVAQAGGNTSAAAGTSACSSSRSGAAARGEACGVVTWHLRCALCPPPPVRGRVSFGLSWPVTPPIALHWPACSDVGSACMRRQCVYLLTCHPDASL